jgi:anti-sigma factor RsiW
MEASMSHEEMSELLGAFALDALDRSEASAVAAHLVECPRCRDEVAYLQQAASMLATPGGEAPTGIWKSIAAGIERPAGEGIERPTGGRMDSPSARATVLARSARSRRSRHSPRLRAGAVLAAAVAAGFAVLGADVARLDHRLNRVAAASAAETISAAARTALLDPTARTVVLRSTAAGAPPEAAVVTVASGTAYLFNSRLPSLPPTETYQLWAMIDGQVISVGFLGAHPATVAFTLGSSGSTDAFAVTVEPVGGSTAPTRPPVASTTA